MNLDTWIQVAIELDNKDLLALCTTNKYFNEKICSSDRIWLLKLRNYDTTDFKHLNLKPRDLYNLVKGLSVVKEAFKLPDSFTLWQFYNRKELNLNNKGITEIPKEINYLSNLQKLDLDKNKIEKIPDTLPNSLQILFLINNKIEKIPDTLPNSLQRLYLDNNKIEKIQEKYRNIVFYNILNIL